MFLTTRKLAVATTLVAIALVTGGCTVSPVDYPPRSEYGRRYPSLDVLRFGDRSGNPSCERAVNAERRLAWRQVQRSEFARQRFLGLDRDWNLTDLKPGARVRAWREPDRWTLAVTSEGTRSVHHPDEIVVRAAFYDSCWRSLFKLERPLTVKVGAKPEEPVQLPPGTPLVVTDAHRAGGELVWTVEDQRPERISGDPDEFPLGYTVSATELRAAAERVRR